MVKRLGILGKMALLAAAMVLIAGMSAWVVFAVFTRGGDVEVPDLTDQDVRSAIEAVSQLDLGMRIKGGTNDLKVPAGHVVSQDPRPGAMTRKYRIVEVMVSRGSPTVHVPTLVGQNLRRAELLLPSAGLSLGRVARAHVASVAPAQVAAQDPPPEAFVTRGTLVNVLVSEGALPRTFLLPDLTGFPAEDVLATLRSWGLTSGRMVEEEAPDLPPGTVMATDPAMGSEIAEGQSVSLTVSVVSRPAGPGRVFLYRYSAPAGLLDRSLKLVLVQDGSEKVVHEARVDAGSTVSVPVNVHGTGTLRVYVDEGLLEEKQVP